MMGKANVQKVVGGTLKARSAKAVGGKSRGAKRKRIAEMNAWMNANHDQLLDTAKKTCIRLTGRPTFGAATRRKSA